MFRASLLACLLSAVVAVTPVPAAGQATRAQLESRVERLREMVAAAREQEARAFSRHDTVRVGRLLALARPDDVETVDRLLGQAWSELVEQFGSDTLAIEESRFAYRMPGEVKPPGGPFEDVATADELVRNVQRAMRRRLDPKLEYLDEFPIEPLSRNRRTAIFIALATSESETTRSCYEGELRACSALLLLSEVAEPELRPLDEPARRLLVETAIRTGGDGAVRRMLQAEESSVRDRLVAAAGVDLDSLVSAWRAAVLEAGEDIEGRRPHIRPLAAASGLVWILLLVFLSTRSSRWR